MNESKFKRLFELARGETPPVAPAGFDAQVLSAIRRERRAAPVSLWDQLGEMFPRLAVAALLVIGTCTAADYFYTSNQDAHASGDLTVLSEQFQVNDLGE